MGGWAEWLEGLFLVKSDCLINFMLVKKIKYIPNIIAALFE